MTKPEKTIQEILAKNIKETRLKAGLTQKELATKCKLSTSFMTEIEKGIKFPSAHTLTQLSKTLNLKYYQLFFTSEDKDEFDKLTLLNSLNKDLNKAIDKIIKEYS